MGTRSKASFLALFLLLLLLPGLQMATGAVRIAPLDENRDRASFPAAAALRHPASYVAGVLAWFDDHYGFRDFLIRTKTQVDYSVFGASDRLHIGRDGFLFYRSIIDTSEVQVEALTDEQLDRGVQTFARLRDWCSARGIHLVVQTQQLKDKFYPEELPREAQFARKRHRFDDFRAKLAALPGITYLDTTPQLMALKQLQPIYHKTDFHWNDPAAFVAAERLVNTIAAREGQALPFWTPKLRIVKRPLSGGQALFMPLFRPPTEMALFVDPDWDDSAILWNAHVPPFEWEGSARNPGQRRLLPPTVVFGDSFVGGMRQSGLVSHFADFRYARLYGPTFEDVQRALPPDTKYLVVEFIEVSLLSWIDMKLAD
jgi:hypothetical protein